MLDNNVYMIATNYYKYDNSKIFNPSKRYLEGVNLDIKSDEKVYDLVRNLFIEMNLDSEHIGTKDWNPFGDFISPDNKVVIKPNLVKDINELSNSNTDCLITNFSIIRPIIDYTIIALKNTGSIIVGDAPVQECNFSSVVKLNGLSEAVNIYNDNGFKIELKDFRKNEVADLKCKIVSLGQNSSLSDVDKYCKKYAITNYNLKYMHKHHHDGIHEYLIPEDVLNADVIINVPKPKTHRKAGVTAAMKNFVGINSKKEYLPHHRNGSINAHGDEYPEKSIVKSYCSHIKNYNYTNNKFIQLFYCLGLKLQKKLKKDRFIEGSWYGNDTIWRTILDINKVVLYANKYGIIESESFPKQQRVVLNIADMLISGEKEGPLLPSPKDVGYVVGSFNALNMDKIICEIMGFDSNKIKYIYNGYLLKKYKISKTNKFNFICNNKKCSTKNYVKNFIPTDGWVDYLSGGKNEKN